MSVFHCNKNLYSQILAASLALITSQAWAYTPAALARGESSKIIKTATEIHFNTEEVDSLQAKVEFSYTELKGLGLVVIYNPILNVLPWAPTAVKQYELDFAATASNQKLLCETIGYSQSVTEDLKTQGDGYTGREFTAMIERGSHLRAELKGNMLRIQAIRKPDGGGSSTKNYPVIKRLVCTK